MGPRFAMIFHLFLILSFTSAIYPQEIIENKYGLFVIDNIETYKTIVIEDSSKLLIDLEEFVPGIKLDIRYATENNFFGKAVYNISKAFLRFPAAESLKKIQHELNKIGLGLKIYDAYRPYGVTVKFYEKYPDPNFVASPSKGSRHNRGCAVDLTIVNLKTGEEIKMPTGYDDFTEKANVNYTNLSEEQIKNRKLLMDVMTSNSFIPYGSEWWHYDFKGWEKFELMDLSFEQLLYFNEQ